MSDEEETLQPGEMDFRFLSLVMSLATAAWSQLGKIPHPNTQKIEKNIEQAKISIEFLRMLLEKTEGNLKPKEEELIAKAVADLELNFVDEMKAAGSISKGPDIIIPAGAGAKAPEIIKP